MDKKDRDQLIRTIYGEASGESPEGQAAIAHVVLNRLASGKFGDTVSNIVRAPRQFQAWDFLPEKTQGLSERSRAYQEIGSIVDKVYSGDIPDITGGKTHYLNPKTVLETEGKLPKWAAGPSTAIGNHTFYGGTQVAQASPELDALFGQYDAKAPAGVAAPIDLDSVFSQYDPAEAKVAAAAVAPAKPLSNAPGETYLSGTGKSLATAGLKGATYAGGTFGNIRDIVGAGLGWLAKKTGTEDYLATAEKIPELIGQAQARLHSPALAPILAMNKLIRAVPDTQDIAGPLFQKTGEYTPESYLGQVGQEALASGVGAVLGGAPGLGGAIGGTIAGITNKVIGDYLNNPIAGALAGMATGHVGGNLLGGPRNALSSAQLPLAQDAERLGLRLSVPQMTQPNTLGATPRQAEATTSAIDRLMGGPGRTSITKENLREQKAGLGQTIGQLEQQANVAYDPQIHQMRNDLLRDMPSDRRLAGPIERFIETLDNGFGNGMGIISGQDFHNLLSKDGSISKIAKNPETIQLARDIRTTLQNAFERNTSPEIAQAYRTARNNYTVASNLTPLVKKGAAGQLDLLQLQSQVNKMNIHANSPQNIRDLAALADTYQTFLHAPARQSNVASMLGNALLHPNSQVKLAEAALGAGTGAVASGFNPVHMAIGAGLPLAHAGVLSLARAYNENPLFRRQLLSGQAPSLTEEIQRGSALATIPNLLGASQ